jgi:hypothetical protein
MKIKIFSDQRYLPSDMYPVPMVSPFFEKISVEKDSWWLKTSLAKKYDRYAEISSSLFEIVPLERCDLAVIPADWVDIRRGHHWISRVNRAAQELSIQFASLAKQEKKPVVIFFSSDRSHENIPIEDAIVFREGLYKSRRRANNFAIPAFAEDLVEHYFGNQLPIRPKKAKPTVGFCGFARPMSWKMTLKLGIYHGVMLAKQGYLDVSPYKGEVLRSKVLETLTASLLVNTNFIIRNSSVFLTSKDDKDEKNRLRYEYVQNLAESDYIICSRGSGNFSFRLYETLSCGRIPVFIDTDCVLPFDFIVDWKKYCVWIDEKELSQIPEKIADFHSNLSPQEFEDLQYECRKFWKDWLSAEGFFANFYRHFDELYTRVGENLPPVRRLDDDQH